jgi:hypothetical protein
MQFCIQVESPATQTIRASGRWSVEAEDSQQAIVRLLGSDFSGYWGKGSVWHISDVCDDCPCQWTSTGGGAIPRACDCQSRRKLLAAGTLEA